MLPDDADLGFMRLALAEAGFAAAAGEVPVGAVVVRHGQVIATGRNRPMALHDPTAHAEIIALRAAAAMIGNYRLDDCELFVTLEPCAMCSGAVLHARLKRVVFGARDPKTGAAGSVLDLFAEVRLNHHTQIEGGVLEAECAAVLKNFFNQRRAEQRLQSQMNHPLREDALRTPDAAFDLVPGYPWKPHYISHLPALAGMRLHYLDEAPQTQSSKLTFLCLHGNPAWSYLYRRMIPVFTDAGHRVVAPDLIGFGKSDKPKRESYHSFGLHRQILLELIEHLDLRNVVLVVQDWGGLLGLTLPMEAPERYAGLLVMNTTLATGDTPLSDGFVAWRDWSRQNPDFDIARLFQRGNPHMDAAECAAYMAPFKDRGYRAATRAFPQMVPASEDADGASVSRDARGFWRQQWQGRAMMVIGAQDPVLGLEVMTELGRLIAGCEEPLVLPEAGHFVQEQGHQFAVKACKFFL